MIIDSSTINQDVMESDWFNHVFSKDTDSWFWDNSHSSPAIVICYTEMEDWNKAKKYLKQCNIRYSIGFNTYCGRGGLQIRIPYNKKERRPVRDKARWPLIL